MSKVMFEFADDYDRTTPKGKFGRPRSPHVDAVIAGHTVFLPGWTESVTGRFSRVRRSGLALRTRKGERDGVSGLYVWAEAVSNEGV